MSSSISDSSLVASIMQSGNPAAMLPSPSAVLSSPITTPLIQTASVGGSASLSGRIILSPLLNSLGCMSRICLSPPPMLSATAPIGSTMPTESDHTAEDAETIRNDPVLSQLAPVQVALATGSAAAASSSAASVLSTTAHTVSVAAINSSRAFFNPTSPLTPQPFSFRSSPTTSYSPSSSAAASMAETGTHEENSVTQKINKIFSSVKQEMQARKLQVRFNPFERKVSPSRQVAYCLLGKFISNADLREHFQLNDSTASKLRVAIQKATLVVTGNRQLSENVRRIEQILMARPYNYQPCVG